MQKKLLNRIINPYSKEKSELKYEVFEQTETRIQEGILFCEKTGMWFPIHQEIAEIVTPDLIDSKTRDFFKATYQNFFSTHSFLKNTTPEKGDYTIQKQQQKQYDEFVTNKEFNYMDFEKLMFWKVVDEKVFGAWKEKIKDGAMLLDVGCGNGRSAVRISKNNLNIVGMDLSRESLVRAISRAREGGVYDNQTYLLADANALPFKEVSFDYAVTSGVLSQVPDPESTCRQINTVLRPDGIYFGMENNKSVFRAVFDILVRLTGKWKKNITGPVPEIKHTMLQRWFPDSVVTFYTTVFNSPTTYTNMDFVTAERKMRRLDDLFHKSIIFKNHGGLIIYQILKKK